VTTLVEALVGFQLVLHQTAMLATPLMLLTADSGPVPQQ
jgi:hypothetical protein